MSNILLSLDDLHPDSVFISPSGVLLSRDGVPLFTEDELVAWPTIPATSSLDPAVLTRLCEYDEDKQVGCRRTQTIFALETEFNTYAKPEMQWGSWDQWCRHDGHIYFNKYLIEKHLRTDIESLEADKNNQEILSHVDKISQVIGYNFHRTPTLEEVYEFFRSSTPGFPNTQSETSQFFQCSDVVENKITIDQLDKDTLNKIQDSFTGSKVPFLANVVDSLYIVDDKVYCTDYLAFEENETARLGILMIPTESKKYEVGKAYFFPFRPLTNEQSSLVKSLGSLELGVDGKVAIVSL
jgi:hypothetical protein